jgi:hypothetical protein
VLFMFFYGRLYHCGGRCLSSKSSDAGSVFNSRRPEARSAGVYVWITWSLIIAESRSSSHPIATPTSSRHQHFKIHPNTDNFNDHHFYGIRYASSCISLLPSHYCSLTAAFSLESLLPSHYCPLTTALSLLPSHYYPLITTLLPSGPTHFLINIATSLNSSVQKRHRFRNLNQQ